MFGNPSSAATHTDSLTTQQGNGQRGNLCREALVNSPQMLLTILGLCLIALLLQGALRLPQPIHLPSQAATDAKNDSTEKESGGREDGEPGQRRNSCLCRFECAYFSFSRFNGRKILYQMRINRDERTCLPFESPKPVTDFADTPISFIPRPQLLHLPGPFLSLNLPQTPPPALTPAPSNLQPEIGFLPNSIICIFNKDMSYHSERWGRDRTA